MVDSTSSGNTPSPGSGGGGPIYPDDPGFGSNGNGINYKSLQSTYDENDVITLGNAWNHFGDTLNLGIAQMTTAVLTVDWTGPSAEGFADAWGVLYRQVLSPLPDICYSIGEAINQYGQAMQSAEIEDLKEHLKNSIAFGLAELFGLVIGAFVGGLASLLADYFSAAIASVVSIASEFVGFDVTVPLTLAGAGVVGAVVSVATDVTSQAAADKIVGEPFSFSPSELGADLGFGFGFGLVDPFFGGLEPKTSLPKGPKGGPDDPDVPVPAPKVPNPKVPDPKVPDPTPIGGVPNPKIVDLTNHPTLTQGLKTGDLPGGELPGPLVPKGGQQHAEITAAPAPTHDPVSPHEPAPQHSNVTAQPTSAHDPVPTTHSDATGSPRLVHDNGGQKPAPGSAPHGASGSTNPSRTAGRTTYGANGSTNPFRTGNRATDEAAAAGGATLLPAARKLAAPHAPEDDRLSPPVTGTEKGGEPGGENLGAQPPRNVPPAVAQPPKDIPPATAQPPRDTRDPAGQPPRDGQPTDGQPPRDEAQTASPVTHNEPSHPEPKAEQDDTMPPSVPATGVPRGGGAPAVASKPVDRTTAPTGAPERSGQDPAPQARGTQEDVIPAAGGTPSPAAHSPATRAPADDQVSPPVTGSGKGGDPGGESLGGQPPRDVPPHNEPSHQAPKTEQDDAMPAPGSVAGGPHGGDRPANTPERSGQDPAPQRRDTDEEAAGVTGGGVATVGAAHLLSRRVPEEDRLSPPMTGSGKPDEFPHAQAAPPRAGEPAHPQTAPETSHASSSRDAGGTETGSRTVGDGHLDLGGGRMVKLPPGTKAGFSDGELWHVTLPDDTVYHRTLDGGWSAPRAESGDMQAIKTIDSVTVKLADGKTITFAAKSDMITDRNVSAHDINGDGKNPADALTPADPNRPAGLGDLDEVNKRGTNLTAIRGKGEDGQVHTVSFGKDGWTEVDVHETHYQATLAAAEKHTDIAQDYLRLAERQEELKGLDTEGLKSLLHGPGSSADDHLAGLYEIGRREQGKSARWVQVAAVKKLLNGHNVNMDAGEGKTLVFQIAVALKALHVSGDGAGSIFVTSRDYLADAAHDTFSVLEKYGFKVIKVSQHEEIPLPVKGEPTIYVSSLQEHAFNILGFKNKQPDLHAFFDEQDESMFYVHQSFIKNNGPDTPAPPTVRGPLEWDDKFVRGLDSPDFVHEPGGNFHLTPSGTAKLKEALGSEPPAERVSSVEQALYAHHGLRENTHYVVNEFDDGGRINLIDAVTGKVSVDDGMGVGATRFRGGLHQRLEVKHGTMVRDDSPEGADDELTQQEYFNHPSFKSVVGASGTNMGKQAHYDAMRPSDEPSGDVYKAPRFYGQRTEKLPSVMASDRADKFDQVADVVIARAEHGDATLALFGDNRDGAAVADALTAKGFTKFTLADAKWFVKQNHDFKVGASAKTADQALRDVIDKAGEPGQVTISGMINRGADPAVADAVTKQGGGGTVRDSSPYGTDVDIQAANRFGRNGDPSTDQTFDDPSSPVFTDSHNPNVPIAIYQYKRVLSASHPDGAGARPGTEATHDGLGGHTSETSDDGVSVRGSDTLPDGVSVRGSDTSHDGVITDDDVSSVYSVASHDSVTSASTATSNSSVSSLHSAGSFDPATVGGRVGHQLRQAGQRLLDLVPTLQAEAFHQRVTDGVFRLQGETFAQLRAGTTQGTATAAAVMHGTRADRALANEVNGLLGRLTSALTTHAAEPVTVRHELAQLHEAVTHWARETGIGPGRVLARAKSPLSPEQRQRMADKALLIATAHRPGDTPALTVLKSAAADARIGALEIRAGTGGAGGPAAHPSAEQAKAALEMARAERATRPATGGVRSAPRVVVGGQSFDVRPAPADGDDVTFHFGGPAGVRAGPRAGGGFFSALAESARLQGFAPVLAGKGITGARELRQAALDAYAAEATAHGDPLDGPLHGFGPESLDYWMEEGARRATELAHVAREDGFAEAIATVIHEARFDGTRLGALLPVITARVLDVPVTMVVSSTAGTEATALGRPEARQLFVFYDSALGSWRALAPARDEPLVQSHDVPLVPADVESLSAGHGAVLTAPGIAAEVSGHVPSANGWFTVAGAFDAAASGVRLGPAGRTLAAQDLAAMLPGLPGWEDSRADSGSELPQVILLACGAAAPSERTTSFAAELAEAIGGTVLGASAGIEIRPGTSEVTLTEPAGWQLHRAGRAPRSYQGKNLVEVLGQSAADLASGVSPAVPAMMVTPPSAPHAGTHFGNAKPGGAERDDPEAGHDPRSRRPQPEPGRDRAAGQVLFDADAPLPGDSPEPATDDDLDWLDPEFRGQLEELAADVLAYLRAHGLPGHDRPVNAGTIWRAQHRLDLDGVPVATFDREAQVATLARALADQANAHDEERERAPVGRWTSFEDEQHQEFRAMASSVRDTLEPRDGEATVDHIVEMAEGQGLVPPAHRLAGAVNVELARWGAWDRIPVTAGDIRVALDAAVESGQTDPRHATMAELTAEIARTLAGGATQREGVVEARDRALARSGGTAGTAVVPDQEHLSPEQAQELSDRVNGLMQAERLSGYQTPMSPEATRQAYHALARGPLLGLSPIGLTDSDRLAATIAGMLVAGADDDQEMEVTRQLVRRWWPLREEAADTDWMFLAAVAEVFDEWDVRGERSAVDLAMRISEAGMRILPARLLAELVELERDHLSEDGNRVRAADWDVRQTYAGLVSEGSVPLPPVAAEDAAPDWEHVARMIAIAPWRRAAAEAMVIPWQQTAEATAPQRAADIAAALPWLGTLPATLGGPERDAGAEGYQTEFAAQWWAARVKTGMLGHPVTTAADLDPWEVMTDGRWDLVRWEPVRTLAEARQLMDRQLPGTLGVVRWERQLRQRGDGTSDTGDTRDTGGAGATEYQWLVAAHHPDPGIGAVLLDGGAGREAAEPAGERDMWLTLLPVDPEAVLTVEAGRTPPAAATGSEDDSAVVVWRGSEPTRPSHEPAQQPGHEPAQQPQHEPVHRLVSAATVVPDGGRATPTPAELPYEQGRAAVAEAIRQTRQAGPNAQERFRALDRALRLDGADDEARLQFLAQVQRVINHMMQDPRIGGDELYEAVDLWSLIDRALRGEVDEPPPPDGGQTGRRAGRSPSPALSLGNPLLDDSPEPGSDQEPPAELDQEFRAELDRLADEAGAYLRRHRLPGQSRTVTAGAVWRVYDQLERAGVPLAELDQVALTARIARALADQVDDDGSPERTRVLVERWTGLGDEGDPEFGELASSLTEVQWSLGDAGAVDRMVQIAEARGLVPPAYLLADAVNADLARRGAWDKVPARQWDVRQALDATLGRAVVDGQPVYPERVTLMGLAAEIARVMARDARAAAPTGRAAREARDRALTRARRWAQPGVLAPWRPHLSLRGEFLAYEAAGAGARGKAGRGRVVKHPADLSLAGARELADRVNAILRANGWRAELDSEDAREAFSALVSGPLLALPAVDRTDHGVLTTLIATMAIARTGDASETADAEELARRWWPFADEADEGSWRFLAAVAQVRETWRIDGYRAAVDLAMQIGEAGMRILPARLLAGLVEMERERLGVTGARARLTEPGVRLALARLVDQGRVSPFTGAQDDAPDWEDIVRRIALAMNPADEAAMAAAFPWLGTLPSDLGREPRPAEAEGYPTESQARWWAARVALALRGHPATEEMEAEPWDVLLAGGRLDLVGWEPVLGLSEARALIAEEAVGTLGLVRWERPGPDGVGTEYQWLVAVHHPDPAIGPLLLDGGTGREAADPVGARDMWFSPLPDAGPTARRAPPGAEPATVVGRTDGLAPVRTETGAAEEAPESLAVPESPASSVAPVAPESRVTSSEALAAPESLAASDAPVAPEGLDDSLVSGASETSAPSAPRVLGPRRQVLGYAQLQGLLGVPGLSQGGDLEWEENGRRHRAVVAVTVDQRSDPEDGHAETLVVFPGQPGRSVRDLFSETSPASNFWFKPEVTGEQEPVRARPSDVAGQEAGPARSGPVDTDGLTDARAQAARATARRAQRSRHQREVVAAVAPGGQVVVRFLEHMKDLDSTEARAEWERRVRDLAATLTRMVVAAGQRGSWPTVEIVGHGNGTFSLLLSDANRPGGERTGRKRADAVRPVVVDAVRESLTNRDGGPAWLPSGDRERGEAAGELAERLVAPGRGARARPGGTPAEGRQVRVTIVPAVSAAPGALPVPEASPAPEPTAALPAPKADVGAAPEADQAHRPRSARGQETTAGTEQPAATEQPAPAVALFLRRPEGSAGDDAGHYLMEGLLDELNDKLHSQLAKDLDEALGHVNQLAESVAATFTHRAGALDDMHLTLVAAPGDGLAASFIANRMANDFLHRTVVLAVDGQLDVNICPD
jgi:hypothetical protein